MRFLVAVSVLVIGCTTRALEIPNPPARVEATMPDGRDVEMTCPGSAEGPTAAVQENAFRISWEDVLHMETASRPVVTWLVAPMAGGDVSFPASIDADGRVSILWQGSVACSTEWPIVLGAWRRVLHGASTSDAFIAAQQDVRVINASTAALIAAGI